MSEFLRDEFRRLGLSLLAMVLMVARFAVATAVVAAVMLLDSEWLEAVALAWYLTDHVVSMGILMWTFWATRTPLRAVLARQRQAA